MRIFGVARSRRGKRKRSGPGKTRTAAAAQLWAVLFLVLIGAFCGPCAWKGNGAAGQEVGRKAGFLLPELDLHKLVSGIEQARKTISINAFLSSRNSPLSGLGKIFVDAERDTGVSAELIAAITLAESSCATDGSLSATNHNAWGMKGPQPAIGIPAEGGYCWWPDWTSAIHGAARFIKNYWGPAKSAGELKGYACGSGSWAVTVEGALQAII